MITRYNGSMTRSVPTFHEASTCIIQASTKQNGDVYMKRFSILAQTLVLTLLLSACGAQVTPTVNVKDLQSTAVAVAITQVAETQASIPTATPPSPTVAPTNTLQTFVTLTPMPTLDVTFTPMPTENPNA